MTTSASGLMDYSDELAPTTTESAALSRCPTASFRPAWQLPRPLATLAFRLKIGGADADAEGMPSDGGAMGARSVQELPVRILTDDELISEYDRTFESAVTPQSHNGYPARWDEGAMRRNSAAMGELLRRGYRSAAPEWMKPADA